MTVLPNSFERYIAALRILTSLMILKRGLNKKFLQNLRKIYTAEAYLNRHNTVPVDIGSICLSLICAASVLKYKKMIFSVNCKGNFLINKDILTILLLTMCRECNQIHITIKQNKIIIDFNGNYKKSLSALNKLKGFYFYSVKTKNGKFVIPVNQTEKQSVTFENEWENLYNRFSPVNLFFENVL